MTVTAPARVTVTVTKWDSESDSEPAPGTGTIPFTGNRDLSSLTLTRRPGERRHHDDWQAPPGPLGVAWLSGSPRATGIIGLGLG